MIFIFFFCDCVKYETLKSNFRCENLVSFDEKLQYYIFMLLMYFIILFILKLITCFLV